MKALSICLLFFTSVQTLFADPIVVAHRGASGYLPEHTLAAVALAHGMNVDYIEQDVVLTKDEVPIILHDIHLDTVTDVAKKFPKRKRKDGRFFAIDFTLKEIRSLKVTERFKHDTGKRYFPKRFPLGKSSFQIPTLAEEIELIEGLNQSRNKNIGIYVEIKHPEFHKREDKDITKIVHLVLNKYGYESRPRWNSGKPRVYIQCFYDKTLIRLKNEFKTKIPLVQLIADNKWGESTVDYDKMLTAEGIKKISTYASGIGPWMAQLVDKKGRPTNVVKNAKKHKLDVHTYTARNDQLPPGVKDFAALHKMLFVAVGVDGVFSDHPDLSMDWIAKNMKSNRNN